MPIAHVTFGTTDLERGATLYDAIMAEFGSARTFAHDTAIGWSFADGGPSLGVTCLFDGQPAHRSDGTMFALMAADEDQERRSYAAALAHGGSCEGPPGQCANGFYAAYLRDPDGKKMNAFCVPAG
jgi:catechol 2,3-dioxygenase-like lactoylglutathione lyase family enzyme